MASSSRPSFLSIAVKLVFILFALLFSAWSALALWFQLPFGDAVRGSIIFAWLALTLWIIAGERNRRCWRKRLLYIALALIILGWWNTIRPSLDRMWAPEVAHTVTGKVEGNIATLHNIRDFNWQSLDEFDEDWTSASYDLSKIDSVDVYLSYWMGPAIAHTLVSFGFSDGRHVVFSGEIRREHHERFSAIGGFFRQFELALIAAEERDIIYLRTNVRKEDVYRYPIDVTPEAARAMFLSYIELGNQLAAKPKWYNTITANCTTIIFRMVQVLDPGIPFDYRIILSGYLPDYLFDHHWLKGETTQESLRSNASINVRAQAGGRESFSSRIRQQQNAPAPAQ